MTDTMSWDERYQFLLETCPQIKPTNEKFKDWFMSKEYLGWSFHGKAGCLNVVQLWRAHCACHFLNQDFFQLICGIEGGGKSTAAVWSCLWIDPKFNIDSIAYRTALEYRKLIDKYKTEKGRAVLIDEAGVMLASQDVSTKSIRDLRKCIQTQRKKNLFVSACVPDYYQVDKRLRIGRIAFLINFPVHYKPRAYLGRAEDGNLRAIGVINKVLAKTKLELSAVRIPQEWWWDFTYKKDIPQDIFDWREYEKRCNVAFDADNEEKIRELELEQARLIKKKAKKGGSADFEASNGGGAIYLMGKTRLKRVKIR